MKVMPLAASLLSLFAGAAGAANLVVNGGFELPVIPAGAPYLIAVTPTGWTGTGDLALQGYAGSTNSGDGAQWFDLNPGLDAGTGISQSINLTAGTTYSFSFVYNGGGGGTTTSIAYSLKAGATTTFAGSVSTAALNTYTGSPWATFATTFTPSVSGLETLLFLPNGVYSGGFIDAVNISAATTPPVPEPAELWLMFGGLAAVATVSRRRRSRSAA